MEVLIVKDRNELAKAASDIIAGQVRSKPESVLGLATGSTPEDTYKLLVKAHQEDGLDFSGVRTFNLDEYLGLPREHDQSYYWFMHDRLFNHVNIKPENINLPDGMAADPDEACRQYEEKIDAAGGIDLQLLGVGSDGHIGFNEPGSSLSSRTRVKTLTEQTIKDNARLFFHGNEAEVPRFSITMGVASILDADQLLLLATGDHKAAIVKALVEGPVTAAVTASALQLHPHATVLIDEAAASKLEHLDYYRWVQSQKPAYEKLKARLAEGL
jgi:glucosamine-6-phosphate deaminase